MKTMPSDIVSYLRAAKMIGMISILTLAASSCYSVHSDTMQLSEAHSQLTSGNQTIIDFNQQFRALDAMPRSPKDVAPSPITD